MSNYKWRDKYYNASSLVVKVGLYDIVAYYSHLASKKGNGSKSNPYDVTTYRVLAANNQTTCLVLSGGVYDPTFGMLNNGNCPIDLVGSGMDETIINPYFKGTVTGYAASMLRFNQLTMGRLTLTHAQNGLYFFDCRLLDVYTNVIGSAYRSIIEGRIANAGLNNTFKNAVASSLAITNLSVLYKCNIQISQSDLSASYANYYLGFDNCNFKIGNETEYTPLVGTDEGSYRANFVLRCTNAGLNPPPVTDYNVTKRVGRWIFDNGSTIEGAIIKDSIFHQHEQRLYVTLGHTTNRLEQIKITTAKNVISSISSSYASNLAVTDNSIQLPTNTDVTNNVSGYVDSGVIWLGGKSKLNMLKIFQNLRTDLGVDFDSTRDINLTPVTEIKEGSFYLVRSTNSGLAEITYSNVDYSSALATLNNIFVGVAGKTAFAVKTGSPVVYEVADLARSRTVKMRIVDAIPTLQITSGSLQTNYWYLVAPTSTSDTSGSITYKGVVYPCYASFLVDSSDLTFTRSGVNVHLRRCWQKDYNQDTEVTDKAFWTNIQKPKWCDVDPIDPRCLMKNNYDFADEMQIATDGNYLTSGHADFYNYVSGENGLLTPAYSIHGAFMQLRIELSTLNPVKI